MMYQLWKNWLLILLVGLFVMVSFAAPSHARFLTPDTWDPEIEGVDINRYAYALNDPINNSDPNGHQAIEYGFDSLRSPESRDAHYRDLISGYAQSLQTLEQQRNDPDNPMGDAEYDTQRSRISAAIKKYESLLGSTNGEMRAKAAKAGILEYSPMRGATALGMLPRSAGKLGPSFGARFENAVRKRYNAGSQTPYQINGKDRIADGINTKTRTITEAKYVVYQGYTRQLKDMVAYAKQQGLTARLVVPRGTYLSRNLRAAERRGDISVIRTGLRR